MDEPLTRIAIIFVLYYSYDDLERFLTKQKAFPPGLRILVVDNTPHADLQHGRLSNLVQRFEITTCVATPENLGYFGAARFAMRLFPELYDFDYVAISNTDLFFQTGDVYNAVRDAAPNYQNVGAIAPRLVRHDGRDKAQLHYIKKPSRQKYEKLARITSSYFLAVAHRLVGDLKRKIGLTRHKEEVGRLIFAPHGAFMILTRNYLECTAGFSHFCFLFNEEIFVGLECEKAKLECVYEPHITYAHDNHGTMGRIPSRRLVSYIHDAHKAVLPLLD